MTMVRPTMLRRYVYRGSHVAIKTLRVSRLTARDVTKFKREAALFAPLDHTNVVRFVGVRVNPPEVCLRTLLNIFALS